MMGTGPGSDMPMNDSVACLYRLMVAAVVVANKFCEDQTYTNKAWTSVASIPLEDLNLLEIRLVSVLQFDLHIPEFTYTAWLKHLLLFMRGSTLPLGDGVPQSLAAVYAATNGSPVCSPYQPRRGPYTAIPVGQASPASMSPLSSPVVQRRRLSPHNLVPFSPVSIVRNETAQSMAHPSYDTQAPASASHLRNDVYSQAASPATSVMYSPAVPMPVVLPPLDTFFHPLSSANPAMWPSILPPPVMDETSLSADALAYDAAIKLMHSRLLSAA